MEYTVEQQRENAKRWIKALRSGDYKQTKKNLHLRFKDGSEGFCCLGVAYLLLKPR